MRPLIIAVAFLMSAAAFSNTTPRIKPNYTNLVINAENDNFYKIIFHSHMATYVKLNIYDERRNFIFGDNIGVLRSFEKNYNFNNIPSGKYFVEIISNDEKVVKEINHKGVKPAETGRVSAFVVKKDYLNEYQLNLISDNRESIWVYIYDNNEKLVHKELLEVDKNLQKVYYLSAIKSSDFTFVIKTKDATITATDVLSKKDKDYYTLKN